MKSPALIRWCGLAAILGGASGIVLTPVLTFAGWLEAPGGGEPPPMSWARIVEPVVMPLVSFGTADDAYYLYGRMVFPIYLLFLIGLLGLRARMALRTHRPAERAFRIALIGIAMNLAGNVSDYWLGREILGQYLWGFGYMIGTLIGTLVYSTGAVLLGWIVLRTGSLPRWNGWVLIVAPILGISLAFWGVHYTPANFILGNSLGWLLLGYVLFSRNHPTGQGRTGRSIV
ncbi:MAG: hypothetical protein ACR2JR_05340 [Rubrobacteraceae bacterium]